MSQPTDLVKAQTKETLVSTVAGLVPQNVDQAITTAKYLFDSKLFPDVQSAQAAFAKIMAGAEYGVPPVQSLNAFHIVKGKIMCHYSLIAFAIRRAGFSYKRIESTDKVAEIAFYDPSGNEIGVETFTLEMAKKKGTQNLDKNADVMLWARAMSQGARKYVPEAFNGGAMYVLEEREEIESKTSENVAEKLSEIEVPEDFDPFPEASQPVQSEDVEDEIQGNLIEGEQ